MKKEQKNIIGKIQEKLKTGEEIRLGWGVFEMDSCEDIEGLAHVSHIISKDEYIALVGNPYKMLNDTAGNVVSYIIFEDAKTSKETLFLSEEHNNFGELLDKAIERKTVYDEKGYCDWTDS